MPQLKIPVWVEDSSGQFRLDAKRQAFKVSVDDKEAPIKSFQGPNSPTIILVVFDTVADPARIDQARLALNEEIAKLDQNYWIGLMRSQDGLSVIQEPSPDRASLEQKIQAIPVSGKAGLLDTLEPVSRLATGMLQKAAVRLCVLYVTDSGIGNYRADYLNPVINSSDAGDLSRRFSDRAVQEQMSRISATLDAYTIPIFILHLSYRADSLNLAYQSGLERIAASRGAGAVLCRTNDEIKPGLENIFARIKASYFLGIESPAEKRSTVKFRVEAQSPQPPARIIFPEQVRLRKKNRQD